ncbi:LysR family transcriptional regulator substrate-binding protein, partial [bacterium AH-315-K03]|nr:LysR family transcriptional regulator substrate-binding protein [bacterium AH-315-K03]
TTKSIIRNTDYVTILPREVVMPEVTAGTLRQIRIREASFQRQVGFLWLKERAMSGLAQTFIDHANMNLEV